MAPTTNKPDYRRRSCQSASCPGSAMAGPDRLKRTLACLVVCFCTLFLSAPDAPAEQLRFAIWHAPLSRRGPGLLFRDILKGKDAEIAAVVEGIVVAKPDILVLTNFDYDAGSAALAAFQSRLAVAGHAMPERFSLRPNTGMATGVDMDGDRRLGGPRDAQGYGMYAGEGGMALLSRLPVLDGAIDLSAILWRDFPGTHIADAALTEDAAAIQRLSSVGHWAVPLDTGHAVLWVLVYHATTPVFDGPEDRNGRRNHDETALWLAWLDGLLGEPPPEGQFVLIGDANTDPQKGEGRRSALLRLLGDPRFQDPRPTHPSRRGEHAADTVDWPDPEPGDLRVSYILPDSDMRVLASGVAWETTEDHQPAIAHKLVWVDVDTDP